MAGRGHTSVVPDRLVFVTRANCPLCEEGLAHLKSLTRREEVLILDVDRDEGVAEYAERVPVVLDPEGGVVAEGRFSRDELRKALRRTRRWRFGRMY